MGARLAVIFQQQDGQHGSHVRNVAAVYDHWAADNATDAASVLSAFFEAVETQAPDSRFGDASYLAAKFVAWRTLHYAERAPLDFLSVGIMSPDDAEGAAEFVAHVRCGSHNPFDQAARPRVLFGGTDVDLSKAKPYRYDASSRAAKVAAILAAEDDEKRAAWNLPKVSR